MIAPTQLIAHYPATGEDAHTMAARELAEAALAHDLTVRRVGRGTVAVGKTRYEVDLTEAGGYVTARLAVDQAAFVWQGQMRTERVAEWYLRRAPGAEPNDLGCRHTSHMAPAADPSLAVLAIGGVQLEPHFETPDHGMPGGRCVWYSLDRATRVWRVDSSWCVHLFMRRGTVWDYHTFPQPAVGSPLVHVYRTLKAGKWAGLADIDPDQRVELPFSWTDAPRSHVGMTISAEAVGLLLPAKTPPAAFVQDVRERMAGSTAVVDILGGRVRVIVPRSGRARFVLLPRDGVPSSTARPCRE